MSSCVNGTKQKPKLESFFSSSLFNSALQNCLVTPFFPFFLLLFLASQLVVNRVFKKKKKSQKKRAAVTSLSYTGKKILLYLNPLLPSVPTSAMYNTAVLFVFLSIAFAAVESKLIKLSFILAVSFGMLTRSIWYQQKNISKK